MGWDIYLIDPVTRETIELPVEHMMHGNNVPCRYENGRFIPVPVAEAHIGITYNYSPYYFEASEGDERFEIEDDGPTYGIRGIYGKTGAESIPILLDMIARIEAKYRPDGEWLTGERTKVVYYDKDGDDVEDWIGAILRGEELTREEVRYTVS